MAAVIYEHRQRKGFVKRLFVALVVLPGHVA